MEKTLGCLLGGAIGDALGAPVEFLSMNEISCRFGPSGITGYVEFWSGQGAFTDDTQMTLFTAEGLIRAGVQDSGLQLPGVPEQTELSAEDGYRRRRREAAIIESVHRAYLRWLLTQGQEPNWARARTTEASLKAEGWLIKEKGLWIQRSPGMTCLGALRSGKSGSTADPINVSKGCGGVMRIAPVGLWHRDPADAFRTGCEVAAITHGNASGYLPAGLLASIIAGLKAGSGLDESIERAIAILKSWDSHGECLESINRAMRLAAVGATASIPEEIGKLAGRGEARAQGGGWTAEEALSIAIYCTLRFPDDFRGGVLAAVNHDGDSDSTAAITGNILGAKLGEHDIPPEWIAGLELAPIVERTARELHAAASV